MRRKHTPKRPLLLVALLGMVVGPFSYWLFNPTTGASLPMNNPGLGIVRGSVKIESKIQSKSLAFNLYSLRGGSRPAVRPVAPVNELENVVLYLEGDFKDVALPTHRSPAIQQINETFVPHVLPIIVGSTVNFPNGDPLFHNVFSLSSARNFDLGRYPKGQTRSVRFNRPGIVKVFCHIHSHMSAVILVFEHPHFCVSDPVGNFVMNGVPPGNYEVIAWHERLKPQKRVVTVVPNQEVSVDIVL